MRATSGSRACLGAVPHSVARLELVKEANGHSSDQPVARRPHVPTTFTRKGRLKTGSGDASTGCLGQWWVSSNRGLTNASLKDFVTISEVILGEIYHCLKLFYFFKELQSF